jgi:hypothetical protein
MENNSRKVSSEEQKKYHLRVRRDHRRKEEKMEGRGKALCAAQEIISFFSSLFFIE